MASPVRRIGQRGRATRYVVVFGFGSLLSKTAKNILTQRRNDATKANYF
jgi:hypothetical protein